MTFILVPADQIVANILNVFSTTSGGVNIDTNNIHTNNVTNNAVVDSQDDTTEPSENNDDNSHGSVSNDNKIMKILMCLTDKIASKKM